MIRCAVEILDEMINELRQLSKGGYFVMDYENDKPNIECAGKPKVAFICVHNSCRSQIAEALGKHLAGDVFESYSAGTETKPQINQDAVRLIKEIYGIDMEANGQHSKLVSQIPEVDMAISMGCNVGCPFIGRTFDDNWGLEDPTGKSDEEFRLVISQIEERIWELKRNIHLRSKSCMKN